MGGWCNDALKMIHTDSFLLYPSDLNASGEHGNVLSEDK
jgi:hypothetical protein